MSFRVGANGNNGAGDVGNHDATAFNKMMNKKGDAAPAIEMQATRQLVPENGGGADYQSFYAKFAKQLDASTVDFSAQTPQIGNFKAQIAGVMAQVTSVADSLKGVADHGGMAAHCYCPPAEPKPKPEVEGEVEVTQGRIWGDPHFVGADGGKYDVQGEAGKTYNILSDTGIQMNAKFKEFTNPGTTVVEKVGITTENNTVVVGPDGSVTVDGDIAIPQEDGTYLDGLVTIEGGKVTVKAGEYSVEFSKFDQRVGGFINNIEIRSKDANSDHVLPSGLWGVTVDGDGQARNGDKGKGTQGGGAIETTAGEITERGDKDTVTEYEVADILDTNFDNFNLFKTAPAGGGHYNGPSLTEIRKEKAELQKELDQVKGDKTRLEGEKDAVADDKADLVKDRDELNKDKTELAKDVNDVAKDVADSKEKLHDLKAELKEAREAHDCETPETKEKVTVTQGRVWGDPHFVGADGGKYDVQGEAGKTYNILSDTGVQMNATFKQWNNPGTTVVEKAGITTDNGNVQVNEDGSLVIREIVGQTKSIPPQPVYNTTEVAKGEAGSYMGGDVTVNDKGHITVSAGEYDIIFNSFASNAKSGDWINNIEFRSADANSDMKLPSGLWGVTVDGDGHARHGDKGKGTQGGGAIETTEGEITDRGDKDTVTDYEVGGLFDTDFQNFNEFRDFGAEKIAHLESKIAAELKTLEGLGNKLEGLERQLDRVDAKLTQVDSKISHLDAKEQHLCDKIEKLEERADEIETKIDELDQLEHDCIAHPPANHYGPDLIVNGGFENHGDLNRGSWGTLDQVEGWKSVGGQFEIQEGNRHGGTPDVSNTESIVELDAHGHESNGGIMQTVHVEKGGIHELNFDFSPRKGPNGIEESSKMDVVVNGEVVATISSDEVGFEHQCINLHLPEGENTIAFMAAGTEDGYGALLDNVSLKRAPEVQQPGGGGNVDIDIDINIDIDIDIDFHKWGEYVGPGEGHEPETVAVDQGRVWGDPHFVGADGGKYDVQGEAGKTYSLLSDQGVQVNATFDKWRGSEELTMVRDVGISLGDDQIAVNGDGTVSINGEEVGKGTHLDGAVEVKDGSVVINDEEYTIDLKQSGGYVNDIYFKSENANADGVLPHGLWGVTVDGDGEARNGDGGKGMQGGGAIEGLDGNITERGDKEAVKLYEVGNLFDTDFANFNKFEASGPQNGFEGWLTGNGLEWANLNVDIDVSVDVDVQIENRENFVNTPMMSYGMEKLERGVEALRPIISNVGTVGAMNEVTKLLTLMSQLLDMIQMATTGGHEATQTGDVQADANAALAQLDQLQAVLEQLHGVVYQ